MGEIVVSTVDVIVIGLGPGGEAAAAKLARAGLSVTGFEARLVGGECPYYGCIPSKMMVRAGNALVEGSRINDLAGQAIIAPDWSVVSDRIRDEATDNWDDTVALRRLTKAGVQVVRGRARLTGPKTVTVSGQEFTARTAIVINTGTDPAVPSIPGLVSVPFWTNRDALATTSLPESLIVIGGGAIGVEFAQSFARFGSRVNVVEASARLVPQEEPESSSELLKALQEEGVGVTLNAQVKRVDHAGDTFTVHLDEGSLTADRLLVATGRTTNLKALGMDALGLGAGAKFVETDEYMRVAPGVYAIGDITGKGAFTHMSMYQSAITVAHILSQNPHPAEYHAVPRVTFTDPEIGSVGLTQEQARASGLTIRVGHADLTASSRGWLHKSGNGGFIKVVQDVATGVLVGATSVGPSGGEVLGLLALAVHARIPVTTLRSMIYAYPTFHRAIESALDDLG